MISLGHTGNFDRPDDEVFEPPGGGAPGGIEDKQRGSLPNEQHRQGDDDIGDPGDDDQRTVDGTEDEAEGEHQRNDEDRKLLAGAVHQHRRGNAGERHHRGDRQIDPSGDDHDGLASDGEGEGQRGPRQRSKSCRAVVVLDELGEDEEQAEEHEKPGDPAMTADDPDQRGRRAHRAPS